MLTGVVGNPKYKLSISNSKTMSSQNVNKKITREGKGVRSGVMGIIIFTFLFLFFLTPNISSAGTIVAATGAAGNWTAGSAWVGGVAPTAADDAQITVLTTSITINVGAVARSADFAGFTGTLTQGSTGTLTLGDATAGLSNIALNIPSGATYAPNSASTITFTSTSATQQTVLISNSYTAGKLTFSSASNGNYAITASLTSAGAVTLSKGTLHTDGASDTAALTHSWGSLVVSSGSVTVLNLGNSGITLTTTSGITLSTSANLTVTPGNSIITFTHASLTSVDFGGKTLYGVVFTGPTDPRIGGNGGSFTNLTFNSPVSKVGTATLTSGITVTGTLTLNGDSPTNRLYLKSFVSGTQRIITNTGATMTWSDVDIQDMQLSTAYDASGISGLSGDAGGNTNITFTTAVPQFWIGDSGSWSDSTQWSTSSGGAANGRVPLPQDNVTFDNGSFTTTSQEVTLDMPRAGHNIDFSAYNEGQSPNWARSVSSMIFGSLTMVAGFNNSGTSPIYFEGRSTGMPAGGWVLTTGGNTLPAQIIINTIGATLRLGDALTTTQLTYPVGGTFDAYNFNVTSLGISIQRTTSKTVTMGSGTWTLTSTGIIWGVSDGGGGPVMTVNGDTSTLIFSNTTATAKNVGISGQTQTWNNVTFSGDNIILTGSNTFSGIFAVNNGNLATGLKLTTGTTQTIGSLTSNGAVGNVAKMISTTASFDATISDSSGTNCANYMTLTDIVGAGGATWNMGADSTFLRTTNLNAVTCSGATTTYTPNEKVRGGMKVRGGLKFR